MKSNDHRQPESLQIGITIDLIPYSRPGEKLPDAFIEYLSLMIHHAGRADQTEIRYRMNDRYAGAVNTADHIRSQGKMPVVEMDHIRLEFIDLLHHFPCGPNVPDGGYELPCTG